MLIGLLAAAPVGAIASMCIQRTMNQGIVPGLVLGFGSALGDFVYAIIAGFGITMISDFLLDNRLILGILGSIFLIIIGIKIYKTDTVKQIRKQNRTISKRKLLNDFFTSFFITLSNPITIIGFGGLFATLGVINDDSTYYEISALLFGVFLGAMLWWSSLVTIVNIFRKKIRLRNLFWINRITGIIVLVSGIVLIVSIIFFERTH